MELQTQCVCKPLVWTFEEIYLFSIVGSDYNFTRPLTVTFVSGVSPGTTLCTNITIIDDDALEGTHNFTIAIDVNTILYNISTPSESIITITDNEGQYKASL